MTAAAWRRSLWPSLGIRSKADMWLVRARQELDRRRATDPRLRCWYEGARPFPFMSRDVVLSYSAKSACTTVVMWYLAVEGHMDAAIRLPAGPWRYPNARLLWSPRFVGRLPIDEDLSTWTLLRVMRSPLKRLVSSFRHAVRTGYADDALSQHFGRPIRATEGLSFEEYLDLLEHTDLHRCNIHHRVQRNPVDDREFGRVTTIDVDTMSLDESLRAFSREHGLPEIPLGSIPRLAEFSKVHNAPPDDASAVAELDDEALLRRRFRQAEARRSWPGRRLEALPEVREAATRLYAEDWAWLERPSGRFDVEGGKASKTGASA